MISKLIHNLFHTIKKNKILKFEHIKRKTNENVSCLASQIEPH